MQGQGSLLEWLGVFRTIQSYEVWQNHGPWVREHRPEFGPGISERFAAASAVTEEQLERARIDRSRCAMHSKLEGLPLTHQHMHDMHKSPGAHSLVPLQSGTSPHRDLFAHSGLENMFVYVQLTDAQLAAITPHACAGSGSTLRQRCLQMPS
jgi:hypothetical protein